MDARKADAVADHLVRVKLAVDPHPVTQRAGEFEVVQEHVVQGVQRPAPRRPGHFRQDGQRRFAAPERLQLQFAAVFRAQLGGARVADRQLGHAGILPLRPQQRAVAAMRDHQLEFPFRLLKTIPGKQRADILQILADQLDFHTCTP